MPGRRSIPTLLLLALAASPLRAQDWLELDTGRFTVLSQLNERDTRQWATEFGRFIDALHTLLPLNENLLPPLTAVLFRRSGAFASYRMRTESGIVRGNTGVFINYSTWSLIAMPGARGTSEDHTTTYHEAVHWFMSADPAVYPLWFREGIAELFSTFEVDRGMARWGRLAPDNLRFLLAMGLQPMEEFVEVTQDEAMHVNATYYSQAALFLHYLLFGRLDDDGPRLLSAFLETSQSMQPAAAFRAAFGVEFDEMDRQLASYARQPRFNVGATAIEEADETELTVGPAPDDAVELSLARLAYGTANDEPLSEHLDRLIEIAPNSPEAYDLKAAWQLRDETGNPEAMLDEAIARGSRDARTFQLKARYRIDASRSPVSLFSGDAYRPEDAREIAAYLVEAANLLPTDLATFRPLTDVLFSIDEVTVSEQRALDIGAAVHPGQGVVLIGRAAVARANGDMPEARRLIDLALSGDYELSADEASAARVLRGRLAR